MAIMNSLKDRLFRHRNARLGAVESTVSLTPGK